MMRSVRRMRNPLIRRVQRHAAMSALFTSPVAAPEGERTWRIPRGASEQPVVKAWLAPTPPPGQMETGGGAAQVSPPLDRAQQSLPREVQQLRAPEAKAQPQTKPPQVIPLAPASPSTVLPQAEPGGSKPEPPRVESEAAVDDGLWKRLQTIFRKHEEKRLNEEPASAENEPLPAQSMREAENPQPEPVAEPKITPTNPLHPPAVISRKPADAEPAPAEPVRAERAFVEAAPQTGSKGEPPKALPVPKQVQEQPVPGFPRQAGSYPEKPEAGLEITNESEPPQDSAGVETKKTSASAPEVPEKSPIAAPGVRAEEIGAARSAAMLSPVLEPGGMPLPAQQTLQVRQPTIQADQEDEPPRALQPMPLEAAWPVQRQVTETHWTGPLPDTTGEPVLEILGLEEHAQVREALREVGPGQPTDSPVEVITPRRPRPAAVQLQEKPTDAPAAPTPQEGRGVKEELFGTAETVPTEIGALPADLWGLIGERPPARVQDERKPAPENEAAEATKAPHASPGIPMTGAPPAEMVQRQAAEPAMPLRTEPGAMLQRAPEPAEEGGSPAGGAASVAGGDVSAGGDASGGRAGSQLPAEKDLDELAVRVYGEVKKRLAVEWERMRRRF